jgi:beta-lactam-binding protein with PASTA domain
MNGRVVSQDPGSGSSIQRGSTVTFVVGVAQQPTTTVPETTVPETTVPETTVPATTVPATTVPAPEPG